MVGNAFARMVGMTVIDALVVDQALPTAVKEAVGGPSAGYDETFGLPILLESEDKVRIGYISYEALAIEIPRMRVVARAYGLFVGGALRWTG